MKYDKKRRQFLLQGSMTLLAAPFLPSLLPRSLRAEGESLSSKPFMVLTRQPHGCIPYSDIFGPLVPALTHDPRENYRMRYESLQSLRDKNPNNHLSPLFGTQFDPYLDQLTLISGLSPLPVVRQHNYAASYGVGKVTLGTYYDGDMDFRPTPDALLSRKIYPENFSGMPLVPIADFRSGNVKGSSWDWLNPELRDSPKENIPFNPFNSPLAVFNALFLNFNPNDPQQEILQADQVLAVDRVLEDYNNILSAGKLSADDSNLLQNYMEMLFQIEQGLKAPVVSCDVPGTPTASDLVWESGDLHKTHARLLAAAFLCGRTKIANYNLFRPGGVGYGGGGGAGSVGYHPDAHQFQKDDLLGHVQHAYNDFVLTLMQELDIDKPTGGKYLDDLIGVSTFELSFAHNLIGTPMILFGGKSHLNTGYHFDYINDHSEYTPQIYTSSSALDPDYGPYNRPGPLVASLWESLLPIWIPRSEYVDDCPEGRGYGDAWKPIHWQSNKVKLGEKSNGGHYTYQSKAEVIDLFEAYYDDEEFTPTDPLPLLKP